jgi:hypothetical protein
MENYLSRMAPLYEKYSEVINPLVAEIEVRKGEFPISILNEIRDFTSHISRCYCKKHNPNHQYIESEISKANGHLERMILDCYKFLIIIIEDICVNDFKKNTKNIDLSSINNGNFKNEYQILKDKASEALFNARLSDMEGGNKEESVNLYKHALSKYRELEVFIQESSLKIKWAEKRSLQKRIKASLVWIGGIIISGIISSQIIPYSLFVEWVKSFF